MELIDRSLCRSLPTTDPSPFRTLLEFYSTAMNKRTNEHSFQHLLIPLNRILIGAAINECRLNVLVTLALYLSVCLPACLPRTTISASLIDSSVSLPLWYVL